MHLYRLAVAASILNLGSVCVAQGNTSITDTWHLVHALHGPTKFLLQLIDLVLLPFVHVRFLLRGLHKIGVEPQGVHCIPVSHSSVMINFFCHPPIRVGDGNFQWIRLMIELTWLIIWKGETQHHICELSVCIFLTNFQHKHESVQGPDEHYLRPPPRLSPRP